VTPAEYRGNAPNGDESEREEGLTGLKKLSTMGGRKSLPGPNLCRPSPPPRDEKHEKKKAIIVMVDDRNRANQSRDGSNFDQRRSTNTKRKRAAPGKKGGSFLRGKPENGSHVIHISSNGNLTKKGGRSQRGARVGGEGRRLQKTEAIPL